MCNEQANRVAAGLIRDDLQQLRIPLRFPEGVPNLEPRASIRITDINAILRPAEDGEGAELVVRRWSWPGAHGRPVYNLRSEGRDFRRGRCLIVADGFYEFTDPPPPADPAARGKRRKDKWLFTHARDAWFCIAGTWRRHEQVGEAYAMLTCAPGPDIAPYHDRQVVLIDRADWGRFLDPTADIADLLRPAPAGTLQVGPVR